MAATSLPEVIDVEFKVLAVSVRPLDAGPSCKRTEPRCKPAVRARGQQAHQKRLKRKREKSYG